MEEGNSCGLFGSFEEPPGVVERRPKATIRRQNGVKKKPLLKELRRKIPKKSEECDVRSSNGVKVGEDEGEETDWPALVSTTSATESVTDEDFKRRHMKIAPKFSSIENSLKSAPFVFQKRLSRIDWRKLHPIDVDKVVREVDLDTLEAVIDTITFSDIQGEDTRNFTEANFIKTFRLAQLMGSASPAPLSAPRAGLLTDSRRAFELDMDADSAGGVLAPCSGVTSDAQDAVASKWSGIRAPQGETTGEIRETTARFISEPS